MPITNAANMHTRPRTTSFQPLKCAFFWIRPNTAENTMNRREMLPAAPLTVAASDNCIKSKFNIVKSGSQAEISTQI